MPADSVLASLRLSIEVASCRGLGQSWRGRDYIDNVARLYCVESGEAYVRHHGQTYRLWPGGLYLIPAHTLMTYWCPAHFVQHWVHFNATLFGGLDLFEALPCAYELPVTHGQRTVAQFRQLEALFAQDTLASGCEAVGILLQLVAPFLETVDPVAAAHRERGLIRFREVLEYIDAHLGEPLRIQDLAAAAHLERTYFTRLFAKHFGVSPARYIQQRRVEEARRLLWSTDEPLAVIAERLAFSDAFHLSKTFKRWTRVSPQAFRQRPRGQP